MARQWRWLRMSWWLLVPACATTQPEKDEAARRKMLELLMPTKVSIVRPFTRVTTFADGGAADGIELLLQASNALDNPGLMIVGDVRVELHEFVPGSGEPKGRHLEQWNVDLSSEKQQRTFWNSLTQMYEFRLGVDPERIPTADKYVLTVTYNSPLGEHLTDECLIEYRKGAGRLGEIRVRTP